MKRMVLILLMAVCTVLAGCGKTVPQTVPTTQMLPQPEETAEQTVAETAQPTLPEPEDQDFVRVLDYIPTARQELLYAMEENFTGQVIYDFQDAYLRYGTVKKLMAVSEDLAYMGMYLKIWDAFRPASAQFKLWEVYPDPTYVANPNAGFSSHSRGNTIDITLVDANGVPFPMPTGFDDFSAKADRDYSDCSVTEANHAQILEILMEKHGFTGYFGEWWHFSDTVNYPVEEVFQPDAG